MNGTVDKDYTLSMMGHASIPRSQIMKSVVEAENSLDTEGRNLFSVAYKNVVESKR